MDKRIDIYIEKSADFAKPILNHLRKLIHQINPGVKETIKWGMPSFDYKGPFCNMAAFKQHCVFGFWKSKLLDDPENYLGERFNQGGAAMGNLGRITNLKDLPPDHIIIDFIIQAKKLNDEDVKLPARPKKEQKELETPADFARALKKNIDAQNVFENFSLSQKREYIEWVTEAKTEETKNRRIATAVEWIAEGKIRNWKYLKK